VFFTHRGGLGARRRLSHRGKCPNSYSAVKLISPSDILEKAAYVVANPVTTGLVRSGRLWPGLWSAPEWIGGAALEVRRPKHFFDPKGFLPDKVTLQLSPPPGFTSAEEFREQLITVLGGTRGAGGARCRPGKLPGDIGGSVSERRLDQFQSGGTMEHP
jgi:hypothetical protein